MSAFINNSITTDGLILIAKGIAGEKINFTRIVLGDGYLDEDQTPSTITDVVSPKAEVDINRIVNNGDGTATVGGVFTNEQSDEGFYYRELALYAEDPEYGEILYCYGNAGDQAEWIPPVGSATIVQKVIDIVTVIGAAANVSAYIKNGVYVTRDECEPCKALARSAYALADEALKLAKYAHKRIDALETLIAQVNENTSKIAILWDAVFSDITTNPFRITFANLDGVTVTSGVWNTTLQRLEC